MAGGEAEEEARIRIRIGRSDTVRSRDSEACSGSVPLRRRAGRLGCCMDFRARPQRCLAGFRASFRFSFGRKGAGKQAERNEKHNENETKNTVEVGP